MVHINFPCSQLFICTNTCTEEGIHLLKWTDTNIIHHILCFIKGVCLPFASTWVHPWLSGRIRIAHLFSFLCCVVFFVLFVFVLCVQCCQCLWIVNYWFIPSIFSNLLFFMTDFNPHLYFRTIFMLFPLCIVLEIGQKWFLLICFNHPFTFWCIMCRYIWTYLTIHYDLPFTSTSISNGWLVFFTLGVQDKPISFFFLIVSHK